MAEAPEPIDMEYRFARDMINVLVPKKVKHFVLGDFRDNIPTPFCFRIRNAVEHFVTLRDLDIKEGAQDYMKEVPDFMTLIQYQREVNEPMIRNLISLLKHVSILAMLSAWHKKWGTENAPDIACQEIRRVLIWYRMKFESSEIFWSRLRFCAPFITKRPLTADEKEFVIKWNLCD